MPLLIHLAQERMFRPLSRADEAELANISSLPDCGTRLGNWLTEEQARGLLRVRTARLKGKRDYGVLALLVARELRRQELAQFEGRGHPPAGGSLAASRPLRQSGFVSFKK